MGSISSFLERAILVTYLEKMRARQKKLIMWIQSKTFRCVDTKSLLLGGMLVASVSVEKLGLSLFQQKEVLLQKVMDSHIK